MLQFMINKGLKLIRAVLKYKGEKVFRHKTLPVTVPSHIEGGSLAEILKSTNSKIFVLE